LPTGGRQGEHAIAAITLFEGRKLASLRLRDGLTDAAERRFKALGRGGDSVGHYEGDTLVIDTVGVKIGPFVEHRLGTSAQPQRPDAPAGEAGFRVGPLPEVTRLGSIL
jgi:hypothetical protein